MSFLFSLFFRVLIHGGLGGVTLSAIQLVKAWGGHVTVTCMAAGTDIVHTLGADDTIDSDAESVEDALKEREK